MSKRRSIKKAMMQLIPKPKEPDWDRYEDWTEDDWNMYLGSAYPSDEEVLSDVRKALGVTTCP